MFYPLDGDYNGECLSCSSRSIDDYRQMLDLANSSIALSEELRQEQTGELRQALADARAEVERLRGRLADSLCKDDYSNGIEGKCTDGRLDGPCFDDRCPHWQPKEGGE
jgi:hypothetical protein